MQKVSMKVVYLTKHLVIRININNLACLTITYKTVFVIYMLRKWYKYTWNGLDYGTVCLAC